MITSYQPVSTYLGNNTTDTYTFDFKIKAASQVYIMVFNTLDDSLVFAEYGNVGTNVSNVIYDPVKGGGSIVLPANLAADRKLIIKLATDVPTQDFKFREQSDFNLRQFENSLDFLMSHIQRLYEKISRTMRFDDKVSYNSAINTEVTTLPVPKGVMIFDALGETVSIQDFDSLVGASGAGLPAGATQGDFIEQGVAVPEWKSATYSGISRFGAWTSTGLKDTIDKILNITYTPPTISLSGSSNVLREKGTTVSGITLSAAVTKQSDPIAAVRFYQGVTLLDTQVAGGAIPTGGTSTYVYAPSFTDNISFSAQVDDNGATGGPTTVTGNTSYSFVYPYYSDAGAVGLSAAAVGALTKTIIVSTATVVKTMTATAGQVFYFAYPASYPSLFSILDVNGFETIGDWTLTTSNITGLDATAQSYKIYEFNNPVTAGSYQYTFKR